MTEKDLEIQELSRQLKKTWDIIEELKRGYCPFKDKALSDECAAAQAPPQDETE